MASVDIFDQKSTYYGIHLRSRRWYVKTFFHFLEIAVINTYILCVTTCEKGNKKSLNHLNFRKDVARDLREELREGLGVKSTKVRRRGSTMESPIEDTPELQPKLKVTK